jgi:UDP-N-acetyl-D-mannosaminuronic acid transferase (WecB/TagA/CpsF family)
VKHSADIRENNQLANVSNEIPRVNILGVGVTPVNLAQTVEILEKWQAEGRREYVLCTSVHGIVEAQKDPEIRSALNRSGLTTEDGMPLVWWCQRGGYPNAGRVCAKGPPRLATDTIFTEEALASSRPWSRASRSASRA